MKNHLILIALFSVSILLVSCSDDEPTITTANVDYAFFVAGHTYGKHGVNNIGLHPPFEAHYDTLNNNSKIILGVLTGDIVLAPTPQEWDEVDSSLKRLNMPIHFAFGNHDLQIDPSYIDGRYGPLYKAFRQENDLFIFLDSNQDSLSILGNQLDFLTHTLDSLAGSSEHIFVFMHHMVWWEEDNIFAAAPPNGVMQKGENVNFWSTIEPLFRNLNKPVFFFSGDGGANYIARSLTYYNDGNLTYTTSGMGFGQKDNYILVEVLDNEEVRLKVVGLNCDIGSDCMGDIEDYLPF